MIQQNTAEQIIRSKEHPDALHQESQLAQAQSSQPLKQTEQTAPAVQAPINKLFIESEIHGANDINWKALPVETLPTKGLFYPVDLEITIKSALNEEIRQWSTIDESDYVSVDKCLNFVLERCVRVSSAKTRMSWKDIKEVDRLFIIFKISELTFPNGENKLMINMKCNSEACMAAGAPYSEKIRMTSDMLQVIDINENLMKFYNPDKRMFTARSKTTNAEIDFTIPTTGVSSKIKTHIKAKRDNQEPIDWAFYKVSPYIIQDWRGLDDDAIEAMRVKSLGWSRDMILHMSAIADKMEKSVRLNAKIVCPKCNEVITRALFFRGDFSIKDIFSIPIGFDDFV